MVAATIYDKRNGQVIMTVEAPDEESVELQVSDGLNQKILWGRRVDAANFYFVAGVDVARPVMDLSINHAGVLAKGQILKVEGIPLGCSVVYPGGQTTVNDGYIEWASVTSGEFEIYLTCFPYKEVILNAIVG